MGDTVVDTMEDTVDTITARGRLRLSPRLMLRPPLLPSLDTDTTVMDMVTVLTDTATPPLTLTDTTVTTARGPLMPSPVWLLRQRVRRLPRWIPRIRLRSRIRLLRMKRLKKFMFINQIRVQYK